MAQEKKKNKQMKIETSNRSLSHKSFKFNSNSILLATLLQVPMYLEIFTIKKRSLIEIGEDDILQIL